MSDRPLVYTISRDVVREDGTRLTAAGGNVQALPPRTCESIDVGIALLPQLVTPGRYRIEGIALVTGRTGTVYFVPWVTEHFTVEPR